MSRNEKGFTLIEIIAVLVILGILAAVAVPRYINMQQEARNNAAQSAIGEVKARANQYYAIMTLRSGTPPVLASVLASVTAAPYVGSDFAITAVTNASGILISVTQVKGATVVGTDNQSIWIYPIAE